MSKNTTPAATFAIGDRVTVRTAATLDTTATGTIFAISKGWYVVTLDDTNSAEVLAATKGKVSARVSSLEPMAPATLPEQENTETAKPTQENTPAAVAPDECPECGGSDLDLSNTNGYVCLECDHEWVPEDEEGDVEEALDEAEEHASKMAEALRKARQRYVKTTRPNGAATAHNGDVIAKELREYEPEDVCKLADRIFALPIGTHLAKYEHLNNGQKRMNAGNRIRGAWRKQEDKEVCDRIAHLLGLNDQEDDDSDLPDGTDLAEMAVEQA